MSIDNDFGDKMEVEGSPTQLPVLGADGKGDTCESTDADGTENENGNTQEIEESDSVSFYPPAYIQRYCRVRETLKEFLIMPKYKDINCSTGKTVMEVGCAEFGMMVHLKSILDIGKILFLDLDEELMKEKRHILKPVPAEYLQRTSRPKPLEVEAYSGCVTKMDSEVYQQNPNIFAVVGIEIIEHLHSDVLRGFEENVFGVISPNIVIVTTPNSDFNVVFNLPPGKFRHWDHKFEWSREEFRLWCEKIITEFKNYTYRIEGICEGPEETSHLGCVSQMAVFEKQDSTENCSDISSSFKWRIQSSCYKLLQTQEYPNYIETRTAEEIIRNELNYFIDNFIFCRSMLDQYFENDTKEVKIPISRIQEVGQISKACEGNELFLMNVLEKSGFKIINDGDAPCLLINVEEYIANNLTDQCSDNDSMDDEREICEDLCTMDVNKVIPTIDDDETWE